MEEILVSESFITLLSFSQPIEANVAKGRLESEGVEVVLLDEHTVNINWLYSNAIGGVKLQVRESEVEKAQEILSRLDEEEVSPEEESDDELTHCPSCNSTNVTYELFSKRLFFLSWLLLNFPLPFVKRSWRCKECDHHWK